MRATTGTRRFSRCSSVAGCVFGHAAAGLTAYLACAAVGALSVAAIYPLTASFKGQADTLAGVSMLLISAVLGGLTAGALVGLLWPGRRSAVVAALIGVGVFWAGIASVVDPAPSGPGVTPPSLPLFWASVAVCLLGLVFAHYFARSWRLRQRSSRARPSGAGAGPL